LPDAKIFTTESTLQLRSGQAEAQGQLKEEEQEQSMERKEEPAQGAELVSPRLAPASAQRRREVSS
jgi:hypothetical protein